MNKFEEPLPDIVILKALHTLWQDTTRPHWSEIDDRYEKKLRSTLTNHLVQTNKASVETLVDYTLQDMRYTLDHDFAIENHMDLLNDFLELVIANGILESIASAQESAGIVATFTLFEVLLATSDNAPVDKKKMAIANTSKLCTTLGALAGRTLATSVTTSLEAAVDAVYGPAVWTLYHDAVADIYDLPKFLWAQHVPVQCVTLCQQQTHHQRGDHIPNDLT